MLKQKQPYMVRDNKVTTKESAEPLVPISESDIATLEYVFDLIPTEDGYVSDKYYNAGDEVITLSEGVDYTNLLNKFSIGTESNLYYDESTNSINAYTDIEPNTKLILHELFH